MALWVRPKQRKQIRLDVGLSKQRTLSIQPIRLQAQPFESHTEGAQAPSSLPPGNKKAAQRGGNFISWRKR